jgi:DNA-directed RNA polymerase subunit RPC12/RpoP
MDKTVRCTICSWRGTVSEAQMTRVQPAELPPQLEEIQRAYEEKQVEGEQLSGEPRPPRCPACGHHTVSSKLHRSAAAM